MKYERNLLGVVPFILFYFFLFTFSFSAFSLIVLPSFNVIMTVLLASLLGNLLFIFSVLQFLKICWNTESYQTNEQGLIFIDRKGKKIIFTWNDIEKMTFASGSYSGTFEFYAGKRFGYYRIFSRNNEDLRIPPTITNRDNLIKEIIMKAGLKKQQTDMVKSLIGGFFIFQRSTGSFCFWEKSHEQITDFDLNVSPRKLSPFKDYLIVAFVFIIIMAIAFLVLYLMKKL